MRFGIARKVSLLTISGIILTSLFLGVYFAIDEKMALQTELNERAYVMLNSLSSNLEYPLLIMDQESIARILRSMLAQKDVVFCKVTDRDGKLIRQEGTPIEKPVFEFTRDVVVLDTRNGTDEDLILRDKKPEEEIIGRIHLTISAASLLQKQKDVVKAVVGIIIVAIILASIASYLLFNYIIKRPVEKLLVGTERIADGDLDFEVHSPTNDEFGKLASAFNSMVRDLKRSRLELEEYSHNLEQKVLTRTKDLQEAYDKLRSTEEQLIQSAKMASLGTLAGGVAHEINNPLTGVLGYAQVLLAVMKKDDPHRRDVTEIEKSAWRCKRIIDNLLRFSRQDTFLFDLVELNQSVDDTLVLIGNQLERNNVTIVREYANDIPTIKGNSQQLQQVFLNIIMNAFDAMPAGGELRIATGTAERSVYVSFRDNGCGIPPEIIDKVFDPFVTTKPPGKGTGLGLSVSYGIVQKHNGQIRVESVVNGGTTFTVHLPVL